MATATTSPDRPLRILCKYPTRGRPSIFLTRLKEWASMATDPARIAFLISYDEDDASMTPEVIAEAEKAHPAVICVRGKSKTKIQACNADLNEYEGDWDVVLLISDDMWCVRMGWDNVIRHHMMVRFPDTDGSLWFYDGAQRRINTLTCYGRKYYERFSA